MIKSLLNKYKNRSDFTRNFLVLFRGTLIAQLIPVLLTPVLTRLYSPADFGVLELFLSVSLILGVIANGRYELAIVLSDEKKDAWNLMSLGMLISIAFSILLILFVVLFVDQIVGWLNESEIRVWLYLIPIAVLFQGWYGMLNYYNTREKDFKTIAAASVTRATGRTGLQLLIGILVHSPAGLIIGQVFGFFSGVFMMMRKIKLKAFFSEVSWSKMKKQGKRYRRFPIFTLPATLANTAAINLTGILISAMYSITSVGFYALANRILGMPGSLIGKSLANVYHKEAVDHRKTKGHAKVVFVSTVKKLLLVSIPIFLIIFLFAEDLFAFVFGEEWRTAGEFAKILIPLLFIRFIFAPVSVTLSVFERQELSLYLQLGLLALSLSVFALSWFLDWEIRMFLMIFVGSLFVYYLFFIFILWRVASSKL